MRLVYFTLNPHSYRPSHKEAINSIKMQALILSWYVVTIISYGLPEVPWSISAGIQRGTFQQAEFRVICHSALDTGDLNRVWCVAAVLTFDPRLSGGPRWQKVKVKGRWEGDGVRGASDGCTGSPVWECRTQTVPHVCLRGDGAVCELFQIPRSSSVCSRSPPWPWGETQRPRGSGSQAGGAEAPVWVSVISQINTNPQP